MSLQAARRDAAIFRKWTRFAAKYAPAWFLKIAPTFFGVVFALALRESRRSVLSNLRLIRGEKSWWTDFRQVGATFAHFAVSLTESLAPERGIYRSERFAIRGKHHVEGLRRRGQGALFVTAHVGPWDSSAMGLRTFTNAPVMMLMAPEKDPAAGAVQDELRGAASITVLRIGNSSLDALPVLQHLQQGGIVVAQLDRVLPGREALSVPLFGRSFEVPRGLFKLAALARVPVVPVFSARLAFSRRMIEVARPIELHRRPTEEQLASCAAEAVRALEAHLEAFPTQWFHFSSSDESWAS